MILTFERISSQTNRDLFICPTDYPYLYFSPENTKIILGNETHWRSVDQTLCTFLTSSKMIKKHYEKLLSMCKKEHSPFEKPLHEIYKNINCLAPIGSLSHHISRHVPTAHNEDWLKLWDNVSNDYNKLTLTSNYS